MGRFDETRAAGLLSERGLELGRPLSVVAVATSTNDLALEAARSGAPHGAVFLAEEQTQGRGRQGHPWISRPGQSLTFSVLLRRPMHADGAMGITLAAGLAVREAVGARVGSPVFIKWPNDLWCREKKLGGILVESLVRGQELVALVIGIGLNVGRELPDGVADTATSLGLLEAQSLDRELLLVDVLAALAARLGRFEADGLAPWLGELRAYDMLLGERVRAGGLTGTAQGIDASGALRIVSDDGEEHLVTSGSVERLGEADVG